MSMTLPFSQAILTMKAEVHGLFLSLEEKAQDEEVRRTLRSFAEDVEHHAMEILSMDPQSIDTEQLNCAYRDGGSAMNDVLSELRERDGRKQGPEDEVDVLELAVRVKKACIAFLGSLVRCVAEKELKERLNRCIVREYEQQARLQGLLNRTLRKASA